MSFSSPGEQLLGDTSRAACVFTAAAYSLCGFSEVVRVCPKDGGRYAVNGGHQYSLRFIAFPFEFLPCLHLGSNAFSHLAAPSGISSVHGAAFFSF